MNYQETTTTRNRKPYHLVWRIEFWQIEGEPIRVLVFDIEKTKSRNKTEPVFEAHEAELETVFL